MRPAGWILLLSLWLSNAAATSALVKEPEPLLLQALSALQQGDLDQAVRLSRQLHETYPSYRLGQLLYLQLNAALAGEMQVLQQLQQRHAATYRQLLEEARLRWQHAQKAVLPEQWVRHWVLEPADEPWWIVVDLPGSRLYLFRNENGVLKKEKDVFVSIGQRGFGKQREGDRRTPVGVYHIESWLPDQKLPPLYGVGALTLNYPNAWDRFLGRTGSGIWLHGTPPGIYVRPPQSSRGCVVLNNNAMAALLETYQLPMGTPVLLLDRRQPDKPVSVDAVLTELGARVSQVLVRYPGEEKLLWRGWREGRNWHVQYWQADGEGGWQLAPQAAPELKVAQQ